MLDEFVDLMRRVGDGSQDAARELVQRFGPHILRVVRRRLHPSLRSKFDPCDLEQEVWAAFFAAPDRYKFERPQELIWFLGALASNKVVEAVRQRWTQKYNANRERCLDVDRHARALAAWQPTPLELAIAREEWKLLVRGQPERYGRILAGLRDGCTQQEVAIELRINQRTVRRVVQRLARNKRASPDAETYDRAGSDRAPACPPSA